MTWATVVFLIVAMSLSIPLLKIWTNHARRRQAHQGADETRVASVEGNSTSCARGWRPWSAS